MSGVYIPGMTMPKSCNACMFDVYGLCLINKNIEGKDELTHSCPLVPVPPHRRLIDADAFERLECNGCDGACEALPCDCTNCDAECRCDFMLDIHAAPTIIPASEEAQEC